MAIIDELNTLGLSKTEANAYLFLLKNGFSSPSQVAKGTGTQRPHCYEILDSLLALGLIVTQKTKNKRRLYAARDPQALLETIRRKEESFQNILPDLRGLYVTNKNKPRIQYFDGIEEVKEIYKLSLEAIEVFGIGSTARMQEIYGDFFMWYQKEIKRRNIVYHDILTRSSGEKALPLTKEILKGLYDAKLLRTDEGEAALDILVWNDNVGFIAHDQPIFGTVVTSQSFATMFKMIFNALWSRMEQ